MLSPPFKSYLDRTKHKPSTNGDIAGYSVSIFPDFSQSNFISLRTLEVFPVIKVCYCPLLPETFICLVLGPTVSTQSCGFWGRVVMVLILESWVDGPGNRLSLYLVLYEPFCTLIGMDEKEAP